MAAPKTQANDASVEGFLAGVDNERRREETRVIIKLMERVTGHPAKMWGTSIIGFDTYHYKYASGREGDWMISGVSPRKAALTIYVMAGFSRYPDLMEKLGKYKTGSSCLYVNKLDDVNMGVLEALITRSVTDMREMYPPA